MNIGMPNQALERTGLSRWVSPWGFWFAHISSPVAQLVVRPLHAYACTPCGTETLVRRLLLAGTLGIRCFPTGFVPTDYFGRWAPCVLFGRFGCGHDQSDSGFAAWFPDRTSLGTRNFGSSY